MFRIRFVDFHQFFEQFFVLTPKFGAVLMVLVHLSASELLVVCTLLCKDFLTIFDEMVSQGGSKIKILKQISNGVSRYPKMNFVKLPNREGMVFHAIKSYNIPIPPIFRVSNYSFQNRDLLWV